MKKHLCTECAKLYDGTGFCPVHPDEPLLDPSADEVRFELMRLDDRRRARTYAVWVTGGGAAGILLGTGIYLVLLGASPLSAEMLRVEILGGSAFLGGFLGGLVAARRYRPRFREWTRDD